MSSKKSLSNSLTPKTRAAAPPSRAPWKLTNSYYFFGHKQHVRQAKTVGSRDEQKRIKVACDFIRLYPELLALHAFPLVLLRDQPFARISAP